MPVPLPVYAGCFVRLSIRFKFAMNKNLLQENLKKPQSRRDVVKEFCSNKNVLDIGCVQHDVEHSNADTWLHKLVVDVSKTTLGVDYLSGAVAELAAKGYNVIVGDVNHQLKIDEKFDVIVVGNLIEHLSSFEGLFNNIKSRLRPGGVALISTANPFFREQYFFSAYKNSIIVNQEHTCWLDPVTLDQLSRRFGLETVSVRWIKERWALSDAIFHGEVRSLDNFSGKWTFHSPPSWVESAVSTPLQAMYRRTASKSKIMRLEKLYGNELGRYLYLKVLGRIVDAWWGVRRILIPSSDINEYELFVSVIKRNDLK